MADISKYCSKCGELKPLNEYVQCTLKVIERI